MNYKIFTMPLLLFLLIVTCYQFKSTTAYFTDTVSVSGNTFTMGVWTTPISTPTPTTIPALAAGDVVINELMWMGSSLSSADEWIELRNTKSVDINLNDWTLEQAGESPNETVTLSGAIPANGYYLITNYTTNHVSAAINNSISSNLVINLALDNGGEQLVLKDQNGITIDSTPSSNWPAGINTSSLKQSMERKSPPGEGTNTANWITCTHPSCNDSTYWDTHDGNDYGTPKADNIYE